uniref:Uncharacterized protein n=1 Tax=Lepeophtheirus salmonis TaxID=72036 RepID=A0A0K2UQ43_LEPSM
MDLCNSTKMNVCSQEGSLQESHPIINLNVPIPKNVDGKVKVTTVSTKTQVRYRRSESSMNFQMCDPQYKITRSWSAMMLPDTVKCEEETNQKAAIEENKCGSNLNSLILDASYQHLMNSVDLQSCTTSHFSVSKGSTFDLYEKLLESSPSCGSLIIESVPHMENKCNLNVSLSSNKLCPGSQEWNSGTYYSSNNEQLNSTIQPDDDMSMTIYPKKVGNEPECSDIRPLNNQSVFTPHIRSSEDLHSPLLISSLNLTNCKSSHTYNAFFKGSNDCSISLPTPPKKLCKICRRIIIEKKLEYIISMDPCNVMAPKALTKHLYTVERETPDCQHRCYFTGIGRAGGDPLQDLSIFGVPNDDPCRIETKIRTTIISEIDPTCKCVNDNFDSFIDRHCIDDNIKEFVERLSCDQLTKEDPRTLRVANIITVAQTKNVCPEEIFKKKGSIY